MHLRGPAASLTILIWMAANASAESIDSTASGEIFWLPLPVEEIASPEALEEAPGVAAGFTARVTIRDRTVLVRRVATTVDGRKLRVGLSYVGGAAAPEAATMALHARDARLTFVAGRVSARLTGKPFAEAVGLVRRASRPPEARAGLPLFEAPAGTTTPSIVGIGLRRESRVGSIVPGLWIVGGRAVEDGFQLGALGAVWDASGARWSVAYGTLRGAPVAGVAGELRVGASWLASEVAVARSGASALVSLESAGGPLRIRGRWRYRGADVRAAACELSAEGGTRRARARLRVSGGPSGPLGSMGRLEVEGRLAPPGAGPIFFRAGRSEAEGFSAADGATVRRERYAYLDVTIARTRGRTLSILATHRERDLAPGVRVGSTLGGRLEVAWRDRARLEVFLEAARADLEGGAAWQSDFHAGGATSLRTRTRPGVAASARGTLRLGRWGIGGLVEGREDEGGRSASAATIWIQRALPASSS